MLTTRTFKAEDLDLLWEIVSTASPMALLPKVQDDKTKELRVHQSAVWRLNKFRELIAEKRKPPPTGEFDGDAPVTDHAKWRSEFKLSQNFFPQDVELFIPDKVKGVIKFVLEAIPSLLVRSEALSRWIRLVEAFKLTKWLKANYADKALPTLDGDEDIDFDDEDDDENKEVVTEESNEDA